MRTFLCVLAGAASLLHCSGDTASSTDELEVGTTFDRIAQARLYISSAQNPVPVRTLPYEENQQTGYAAAVAADLHTLSPTYVSGLIRYNGPLPVVNGKEVHALQQEEIDAFDAVRKKLPGAKLDVVLSPVFGGSSASHDCAAGGTNPPCNVTPDQMKALMADIENAIHPDIWFFDFFTDGRADTAEAAIFFAHKTTYGGGKSKQAQLVGGHYFGGKDNGTTDANFFAVVDDACGDLGTSSDPDSAQSHIDMLNHKFPHKPILLHANNNAQNGGQVKCKDGTTDAETFACKFNDWPQSKRKGYIDMRAAEANEAKLGFTFMFPAFFPACGKGDPNADPLKVYYDSAHDGLLTHIGTKM